MLKKKKNNKGFTLIELLVVIAIIGILAVVAVPALFNNINKAKVADLKSDYNAYKSAALAYYTDNNSFPTANSEETLKSVFGPYMDNVPVKSPFDTEYIVSEDTTNHKLLLTTTYDKLKTDNKLADLIKKDSNGVMTVDSSDGKITMTLISNSQTDSSGSTNTQGK